MDEANSNPPLESTISLELLLPVIRTFPAAGACSHDSQVDLIALYEDRIVLCRKRGKLPVPPAAFEPGGSAFLKIRTKGKKAELTFDEIDRIEVAPLGRLGRRLVGYREYGHAIRITHRDGRIAELNMPKDEARYFLAAARRLESLSPKLHENASLPRRPRRPKWLTRKPYSPILRLLVGGFIVIPLLLSILIAFLASFESSYSDLLEQAQLFVIILGSLISFVAFIFVLLVFARSASQKHHVKKTMKRAKQQVSPAASKDRSNLRPWRSPLLGLAMKILGAIAFLIATFLVGQSGEKMGFNLTQLIALVAYLPATCLIYYGYRFSLISAEDDRSEDSRPPILFLRSFEMDAKTNFNPKGTIPQLLGLEPATILKWLGPLGNANPIRLLRLLFSRSADHSEEQLAGYMRKLGPFVAIGKPGERLALGGASRAYVDNEHWQETVLTLIKEAQIVVLQPGDSSNVWWEVKETFKGTSGENVLFSLLNCEGKQWRYDQFRVQFETEIDARLPRALGENSFLYFSREGPRLLPLQRRWHFMWPAAGCAIHFGKTLSPFLANRREKTVAPARKAPLLIRGFSALGAIAAWTLIIYAFHFSLHFVFTTGLQQRALAKLPALLEDPRHAKVLEGNGDIPYRLTVTRDWEPLELPDSVLSTAADIELWQYKNLVGCSVGTMAADPRNHLLSRLAEDPEKIVEIEIDALRQQLGPDLQILGRGTTEHAGRVWQTLKVGAKIAPDILDSHPIKGPQFHFGADLVYNVWAYSGPEGLIEFISWCAAHHAQRLEPAQKKIFGSLSLGTPQELLSGAKEPERQRRLELARKELPGHLVDLRRDKISFYHRLSQELALQVREPWTREDDGYALGNAAKLEIRPGESIIIGEYGSKDFTRSTLKAEGVHFTNLQTVEIKQPAPARIEASFDAIIRGERQRVFQCDYETAEGRYIVRALVHPEIADDLWPHLKATCRGVSSDGRGRMELAELIGDTPTMQSTEHLGKGVPYTLRLANYWTTSAAQPPFDKLFELGAKAAFYVIAEPAQTLPPDLATKDLVSFAANAAGESFKHIRTDELLHDGERWTRVVYLASPQGLQFRYTAHYLVNSMGAFQVTGLSDFETAEAHDEIMNAAFKGFELGSP